MNRQQDEHELVAALSPENPLLFAHARRILRDVVPAVAGRFAVGRTGGGWAVLRGDGAWSAVCDGADPVPFGDARSACAHVLADLMLAGGMRLNSEVLTIAGIAKFEAVRPSGIPFTWELGEEGERLRERGGDPPPDTAYISLENVTGRSGGHFPVAPFSGPGDGPYATVREVLELFARNSLPDPVETAVEVLPEGTEVDSYGDQGQVMAYAPGTPFSRRALWGSPSDHPYRRYRVQRPLRVYPAFWFPTRVVPVVRESGDPGQGYYLVDSIADLLRSGALAEAESAGRS